jgi:molybdopterin molybdotransferase
MITVAQAENIVFGTTKDFGTELLPIDQSTGRVLAEDILADRDIPAFNRVTMDGIAIQYKAIEQGITTFQPKGTQAAGDEPLSIDSLSECVEIMTGCALPPSTDTVIRYEDLALTKGTATVKANGFKRGQNVHACGSDKKQGEIVVAKGRMITPALINVAASVGADRLPVKQLPRTVIISTGNELVDVGDNPSPYQIRQSNNHSISAALKAYGIGTPLLHLHDELAPTKRLLKDCVDKYDVLLLTGGVSAGKFDYLPEALEAVGVQKLFHKVAQKPGKPFWFGKATKGAIVFAFPGNPVSSFLCLQRYFIPWLRRSLGLSNQSYRAVLAGELRVMCSLDYFLLVKLQFNEQAQLMAQPIEGNGSGDLVSLADADAFMELPFGTENVRKGESYRVWPFKDIL